MHLVDYIDLVLELGGKILDLVAYLTDVLDAVVRRRVHFDYINTRARSRRKAGRTLSAGVAVFGMLAVHGAREYLRAGRLACSSRTAEKVRVRGLAVFDLIAEYRSYVILTADIRKGHRTPFAVKRLMQALTPYKTDKL